MKNRNKLVERKVFADSERIKSAGENKILLQIFATFRMPWRREKTSLHAVLRYYDKRNTHLLYLILG